jgi:KTSC domain
MPGVASSAIEWTSWRGNRLTVAYRGGEAYDYFDVPEEVYRDFLAAESKGQFVNFIIKPHYRCQKRPH